MSGIEGFNLVVVHVISGSRYENVIGEYVAGYVEASHQHDPGPYDEGHDHHRQRGSLRYPALPVARGAEPSRNAVV